MVARILSLKWSAVLLVAIASVIPAQNSREETEKIHTLRMGVDLVLVDATVTESKHESPVRDLKLENFQIIEDKIIQDISSYSTEDVPVSVGVIFDISGSMKDKLKNAIKAAQTFFRSGTAEDEYFLIEFSSRPQIAADFTSDISKLQIGFLNVKTKGSTALYDAVYLGLTKLKQSSNPKKALLLITDGEDNHSRYSFRNLRDYVREQDVKLYAIGMLDPKTGNGRLALRQLTELTGGRAYFPFSSYDISEICKKIAAELKNQYVLGYRSTNTAHDGEWRKIKVKLVGSRDRPDVHGLKVRARKGYFAPSGDTISAKRK